jgi:hypothetical protein
MASSNEIQSNPGEILTILEAEPTLETPTSKTAMPTITNNIKNDGNVESHNHGDNATTNHVARATSGITSITTNGNNNGATMPNEKNTNKCSRIWSFLHKKQQDKDGKEIAELIMGGGVPALGREGGFQI